MAKGNRSFLKKFISFFVAIVVFCGVFYYLYEYTNVLSKLLGKKYEITFIIDGKEYKEHVVYDSLPTFDGTPSKEPTETIEYVFDGWATAPVANGTEEYTPIDFSTYTMPDNNTTVLYAVYRYAEEGGEPVDGFVKVTEALSDWTGDYVIVDDEYNVAIKNAYLKPPKVANIAPNPYAISVPILAVVDIATIAFFM